MLWGWRRDGWKAGSGWETNSEPPSLSSCYMQWATVTKATTVCQLTSCDSSSRAFTLGGLWFDFQWLLTFRFLFLCFVILFPWLFTFTMRLRIAGNFRGEKLSQIGWKIWFRIENSVDCSLVPPKDTTPPNFMEKTSGNSHKTSKFTRVFSLKSLRFLPQNFEFSPSLTSHMWQNIPGLPPSKIHAEDLGSFIMYSWGAISYCKQQTRLPLPSVFVCY